MTENKPEANEKHAIRIKKKKIRSNNKIREKNENLKNGKCA